MSRADDNRTLSIMTAILLTRDDNLNVEDAVKLACTILTTVRGRRE